MDGLEAAVIFLMVIGTPAVLVLAAMAVFC